MLSPTKIQKCTPKNLTKGLKKSIRKKHKLYKAYLTSPSPLNFKFYSSYRNKLHHLLRIAKSQHYVTKFNEAGNNVKSTWSIINEIMTASNKILCDEFQGGLGCKLVTDLAEIADGFNDFFVNIGPSLGASIPYSPMTFPEIQAPPKQFRFRMIETAELEDIAT